MTIKIIDFANFGGPVYAGRPKGERARLSLGLDAEDRRQSVVTVTIPADTYSLNSSFFLGLFGPSVTYFSSREKFLEKYSFRAADFIMEEVERGIDRALSEVSPL